MLIGRESMIETLQNCCDSDKSEFVVVYGIRRVGKTFLIKEFFGSDITFYTTSLKNNFTTKKQVLAEQGLLFVWGLFNTDSLTAKLQATIMKSARFIQNRVKFIANISKYKAKSQDIAHFKRRKTLHFTIIIILSGKYFEILKKR